MNLLLQTFCHQETLFLGLQVSKNSWVLSAFSLVDEAVGNLTIIIYEFLKPKKQMFLNRSYHGSQIHAFSLVDEAVGNLMTCKVL